MKIYAESNTNANNIILEIPVEVEIVIPDTMDAISASDDRSMYDETDNLILSEFDSVVDDMETVCRSDDIGLECIFYDESESKNPDTGELSCSRYLDFCVKKHKDLGIVRVVFMLRVTDHRLTNKRRDGSDRTESIKRRRQERINDYISKGYSRNNPDSQIYPFFREIIVGPKSCRTESQAMNVLLQRIGQYKSEIERRKLEDSKKRH